MANTKPPRTTRQKVYLTISAVLAIVALLIGGWIAWVELGTNLVADNAQEEEISELHEEFATGLPTIESQPPAERGLPPVTPEQVMPATPSSKPAKPGAPAASATQASPRPTKTLPALKPVPDKAFGIIRIPRFGTEYEVPVLEYAGQKTLERGYAHYVGTAMPCEVGNFGIAGHRTTYGRPFYDIDKLEKGDQIIVETKVATCTYRMIGHKILDPSRMDAFAPVPFEPGKKPVRGYLTGSACHPKHSDAQRYVITAELANVKLK